MRYIACLAAVLGLTIPAAASALPSIKANPANKMLKRGLDPIQYDRATRCNGGHVFAGTYAMVNWLQHNASGVNWGEYRCEKWGKHEASIHSAGRAIDWHPSSMAAGRALVKLLLAADKDGNKAALARRMGIQGLIFNCKSWFGNWDGEMGNYSYCYGKNGKRKKNLDPTQAHMNHVHIELNNLGAKKQTTFWNKNVSYPVQDNEPGDAELDTEELPEPTTPVKQPTVQVPQTPVQQPSLPQPDTYSNSGGSTDGTYSHHHWNSNGGYDSSDWDDWG